MTGRLEATHRSFTLACRLMRVFRAVVEAFVSAMLNTWHHFLLCRLVAPELVRDQDAWHVLASFEQLAEEFLGSDFISTALHQDIQHIPILVNRTPEIGRLAGDLEKHFVQVPFVSRFGSAPT